MFHDLKDSFLELIKNGSHTYYGNAGVHISFPEELWERFEQEFNLCFQEEEEDPFFERWQDPLMED
jgi:hypothetical protein